MIKYILSRCALVTAFTCLVADCALDSKAKNTIQPEHPIVKQDDIRGDSFAAELLDRGIKFCGQWDVGEESPLIYIVTGKGKNDQLSILNSSGSVVYKKYDVEFERIYQEFALRKLSSQLVFEYSEGGNDSFVQMLDFNKGTVSEKIDDAKAQNAFSGGIWIKPQFRSNANAAKEPFDISLVEEGLTSPGSKKITLLRYDGTKYRPVGYIDASHAEDLIEQTLQRNN